MAAVRRVTRETDMTEAAEHACTHGLFVNSSSILPKGQSPIMVGHLTLPRPLGGWGDIWKTLESELADSSPGYIVNHAH